ncbi:hypothetical protein BC834DRAFT_850689 [Gloeopeniophorella convolvens]|nr:hypothetical protein BC834DRAFT_850689 [Gloeopeniophorella convolvens]
MVGERYRDLLQASSSIISISQSSQDVLAALEDVRTSIPAEKPQSVRRTKVSEKDDAQLRVLQSLAAHMKLLLDTPEHIWRLLEKKRYLYAGWLFLLARVIHRTLVRDDAEDEDDWRSHGIDVAEQFPLVQRQWDTVAQFRAQITYKATLSLRDSNASLEDVCSVLLTLHLLESRPLIDTLTVFLAQRTRSLQATLSRNTKSAPNGHAPQAPNGSALPKPKKVVVRQVREELENVLEAIALTVSIARDVFRDQSPEAPSLMSRVLSFVQSDAPAPEISLPPELQMSTQHLLSTLPSASHLLLLPNTIRSLIHVSTQLAERLNEWFGKAVAELRTVAEGWFSELRTLREVRTVRLWFDEWLAGKRLEDNERSVLVEAVDGVAHSQALEILRTALANLQDTFRDELQDTLSQLRDGTGEALLDCTPAKFLFQPPPPPPSFDVGVGSPLVSAFRKYEAALQRQVTGRTPLLHKMISTLEHHAKALQEDSDGKLTEKLRRAYAPLSGTCCKSILEAVSSNVTALSSGTDTDVRLLAFLCRLAEELLASPFAADLRCGTVADTDFHESVSTLRDQSVDRWRGFVVINVLAEYQRSTQRSRSHSDLAPHPSWPLVQALSSLAESVYSVDAPPHISGPHQPSIAEATLRQFVASLVSALGCEESGKVPIGSETQLWDLKFLRRLLSLWHAEWDGLSELDKLIGRLQPSADGSAHPSSDDTSLEQHILRNQILLAPLLPPAPPRLPTSPSKSSTKDARTESLLLFGVPAVEQTVQPIMDLVKPGPRFGSLLVGNTIR